MKQLYFFLLIAASAMAQPSVKGRITLHSPAHDRDYIVRNTKVVLLTKASRDTVAINDRLEFEFPAAAPGTGFLYLSSPVLPHHTEYKFRIKKKKPTSVSLEYDKFQTQPTQRMKTPEEREHDLDKGLFFARLAVDVAILIHAITR